VRFVTVAQIMVLIFTVISPVLPWLKISYSTGNHLQRVAKVFEFFDSNANNVLDYTELNLALKDKNFVFFDVYTTTNSELIQALLADQSNSCLFGVISSLQSRCAIGESAACLQPENWATENGNFMQNPKKLQQCILSLMESAYISSTGDSCTKTLVDKWLTSSDTSSERQCLLATSIDMTEFARHARQLIPGLPADELDAPNHCINASVDMYLSIYGSLTVEMSLTTAYDADKPRCHSALASAPPKNFTCITVLDFFSGTGLDLVYSPVFFMYVCIDR
jgi:hypothetical protein